MLWPFNHFRKKSVPSPGTIEAIYGMIVTQARDPAFYRDMGVPDSVDSRFDMLVLHLWMVVRVLKQSEPRDSTTPLSQALFDHFCSDMDHNLREMGVGDMAVPKRMQGFGRAFYGRVAAYDAALGEDPAGRGGPLAKSLDKNIYNSADRENARKLAVYVVRTIASLSGIDAAKLEAGWKFPSPQQP